MHRDHFSHTVVILLLALIAGINLLGTYYVNNLYDFNTFVRAGQAVLSGENPYALPERLSTNLNPPLTLLVFQFLPRLNTQAAYQVTRALSLILYLVIVTWLARAYPTPQTPTRVAWALAMTGIWYTLLMGQMYVFLLLLCVLAWHWLEKGRSVAAGLMIGLLAAVKPNFLVWPGLLLLSGAWIPALSAFGTTGLLSLLPLTIYGPQVYRQWIEMLLVYKAAPLATNMSLIGLASRLGLPAAGTAMSLLILAGAAWIAWRKQPNLLKISGISIVVSLLATAFSWVGYAVLLLPIFFSRRWTWKMVSAAALLCVPSIIIFYLGRFSPQAQFAGGLVFLIPLVLILIDLLYPTNKGGEGSESLSSGRI